MEATATTLLRPAARRCLNIPLKPQVRTKATASRTKRALNIPPHSSFLAATEAGIEQDTIVFNPPSAAPSVYHTPFKFLPKNDPRRRANLASLLSSSSLQKTEIGDLPEVAAPKAMFDRDPITKEEVEEMRMLRSTDPYKWSVKALSEKYQIPTGFVVACCQAPREKIDFERRKFELSQQRWGPTKRKAMEDRHRRNQMLLRGEI
ncbi:hypothetical protein M406DRAFT_47159 [Cryphonectria parasitica EP155]|uniref:Uncharacterized protein n=1 Tax=Cryphonectria parasitica (strain ATCC 38755 / EP155) TaxID=660469 RepID=A0A9P5CIJ3_CRYP1|nr:uncharacterized protein M406DRAFT_47159 [Cryphonectria parasitica EP155]KAF3760759.1 hypothetical protein M406DRAFT_47159 [Cryphonectria parasitica EP155]